MDEITSDSVKDLRDMKSSVDGQILSARINKNVERLV